MDFDKRVTWITGASSGLGEALAYALSAQGAVLVLSARRQEKLDAVRSWCRNAGQHLVVPLDLSDPVGIEPAAGKVLAHFGRVDLLINNAGVTQRALAKDTSLAVDRRIMEIDYFAAIALTKAVLPSMLARRSGRIVVISSVVGRIGTPLRSAYAASKHALHGFFDSLRAEVHADGIGVTVICPGFLRTEVSMHALKGDGTAYGALDPSQAGGMPPETCAARVLEAISHGRDEVVIGGRETYGIALHRFFPALFRRVIRKIRVT